jgi:uncharacterized protein (UPF0264 family)
MMQEYNSNMTKWLASVQSVAEAQALLTELPDILDMKNPSQGALGALPVSTVSEIVDLIDGRCQTSATIGDLAMDANVIGPAIIAMANSGVDYVKMGLFPDVDIEDCIQQLNVTIKPLKTPVIAVLFADKPVSETVYSLLAESGFKGIMVDTAIKNGKHLLAHQSLGQLSLFVEKIKGLHLMCGLAGSLRVDDIATLAALKADYLGFRSALCDQQQRTLSIDIKRVKNVKTACALSN